MNKSALNILEQTFGYDQFRGQQADIIEEIASGRNALVLMPTGGGKSLCYQIPALMRDGVGVVISPLIALMQDQVDALQQLDVKAGFLNSTMSFDEQRAIESALRAGDLDLLYIAPERLIQAPTMNLLSEIRIALFAIDEAHCVSQWGHDFRSDYLQLDCLNTNFPDTPRIALTATADERTRAEIISRLSLDKAKQFVGGFDRPNIQYRIALKQNGKQQLLKFLRREHESDAGIVYCLSRKKVEATAEWLTEQGFNAYPYHAGLSAELRQHHQQKFLREDGVIIVATIAFGMGIDKPDVRFVAHLDLPKSIEAYYQETGRAGRDGEASNAWLVYGLQDVIKLREMMSNSQGSDQHKRVEQHKLNSMLGFCEITSCRRQVLLNYFGESDSPVCGNCDTCLNPAETWDATVAAQKALSTVFRTGQRFGVNHLIDVLLGADSEKIKQFGHDGISTYGIGKELDAQQWRSVFRQLVARAFLNVDLAGYGGLFLAEKSRPILKGQEQIQLRRDNKEAGAAQKKSRGAQQIKDADKVLWEALRSCRKMLAEETSVPPYVIFHDATLMDMLHYRPLTGAQFLKINGVGESKLEKYGQAFLKILNDEESGQTSERIEEKSEQALTEDICALFLAGESVELVAEKTKVAEGLVYSMAAKLIEAERLNLKDVLIITEDDLAMIEDVLLSEDELMEKHFSFKGVKEQLPVEYPIGLLKCVRASIVLETNG